MPAIGTQLPEASFIGQTVLVTLSTDSSTQSPRLSPGYYALTCADGDIYIRQGSVNVAVTTNDFLLKQNAYVVGVKVTGDTDGYLAFLRALSASMTVRITNLSLT